MLQDPIADLITRIRNAYLAKHKVVIAPYSKLKDSLLKIMLKNNYIKDYKVEGKKPKKELSISLKYPQHEPAIDSITRISKPGRRVYVETSKLNDLLKGRGITILSTSKGVITAKEAKQLKIGGEVICKIN